MSGFIVIPQTITGSGSTPIGAAGGELSGTYPNPNVAIINGAAVPDGSSAAAGYVLHASGSGSLVYAPINLAGGTTYVSGVLPTANQVAQNLSGDISGTTASATVAKVNGTTIPSGGSLTIGNLLQVSGSSALSYAALNLAGGSNYITGLLPLANQTNQILNGDLTGNTSSATVVKINGTTLPAGGSLTTGNVLQVSGAGALTYSALNLAGGSNFVSGILPIANQASQNLSGDLSGTTSSSTVIKINGTSVPATPSVNQVLIASNGTTSSWSLISNANIASNAAIDATKLAYSDVSSPSLSATTVQSALDAVKTQAVATAIQRLSQTITTSNLQAAGGVSTGTFNIGSSLPANARLLGAEINTTQILGGIGLSIALASVQGGSDLAGSIITGATVLSTGLIGMNGTNQYLSRGSQQLTITVVLTGALFNALTAGNIIVNIFYAIVS